MAGASEHRRFTVHYSGMVQGVGFRFTAERLARRFAVTGYVRNLRDGGVELVAEGEPAEIARFLHALAEEMADYIRDRRIEETPATGEFTGFQITH